MAKRRFIQQLPSYNQTTDLTNFFGSTVDEVFQPGTSQPISGYIGEVPSYSNSVTDFYVAEPTASRAAYQLEPGMVSYDPTSGTLTNVLSYPDFVAYLAAEGANVTNQQRMFETDYYAWAPPINIDMLVNYSNYYWFGNVDTLPTLTLTIPVALYTGDGATTTFALPAAIAAVSIGDEVPGAYVDDVPVSSTRSGNNLVLASAPSIGTTVMVARTANFAAFLHGQTTVNISGINTEGVEALTSTMRIKIVDAEHIAGGWDAAPWDDVLAWDSAGDDIYWVDDVGTSIRVTQNNQLFYGLEAQYVTIDRSSLDGNAWSLHNFWVHKDSFAWSNHSFPAQQGVRPIIEFVRDIVLYPGQAWQESIDPLFMLYDVDDVSFGDPGRYPASNFYGNRIFGYAAGSSPIDPILLRALAFDANGYPLFQNDAYVITYQYGTTPITGLACYATNAGSMSYSALWHTGPAPTTQAVLTSGFYAIPHNLQANPSSEDVTQTSRSTWVDHFQTLIGNQAGLVGNPIGDNNYRDTLRQLNLGIDILQHRAPLLRAMLLASSTTFDLPQAIRYVDQEYNRFRNKFIRQLVIINNKGLLSGVDPTVDPNTWVTTALNAIKIAKNNQFPFAFNTIGGAQYFIPPTPAALGIMPTAVPAMVTDTTYPVPDAATPLSMILGHDGSLTAAFGDYRDNCLLALEQLIYANLPTQFQTEARPVFDLASWMGNRFFAPYNGYTWYEWNAILVPMFQLWAQQNRLDYRTNASYDPADPFTWNYNGVADIFGNIMPGNWRAIYRFYYGTDAPHTRPWEMLGFSYRPTWWVGVYGSAPYTLSNTQLWTDLENGTIQGGPRHGTDADYARPGLSNLNPVDDAGNLLNPVAVGIVMINVPAALASRPWQPGDGGPVEDLWIKGPSYRYALSIAAFFMKPARFIEECWDTINIGYVGPQWVELATYARPLNAGQYVNGETLASGATAAVTGLQQWLGDNLVAGNLPPSLLGNVVRGLDVRLLHQMAGYVSSDNIQVAADNFGLIPSEDAQIALYQSPTTDVEVYSGVILEWTGQGWRAIGYDARNPAFTIIPPDTAGPKGVISLATANSTPTIVPWRTNTYYAVNVLVSYQNSVYQCLSSHTSGAVFEQKLWQPQPDLSVSAILPPQVTTYTLGLSTTQSVPYGTEFLTYQQVADFLLGWQRWLLSRGWIFDGIDPTTSLLRDWSLAVREFLNWTQVQWEPGNFIALSPAQQGVQFYTPNGGTILNVEDNTTGFFGLLDRSGSPINQRDVMISRLDGSISLTPNDTDIYCARLEITEYEHVLVFSNVTIFQDNIYLPLFNMRQLRLSLSCGRSIDWQGRLDAPGYVIVGNQLESSFQKNTDDIRLMFDIELADRKTLYSYARHNVNFQELSYFDNLLMSDVEQFEFYQGMIQAKGTTGAFEALMRSTRASANSDTQFLQEWALRFNIFGAPLNPLVTFQLLQSSIRLDPQLIRFVSMSDAPPDWIIMPSGSAPWIDVPQNSQYSFFVTTSVPQALPSAGPVRVSDVTNMVLNLADVPPIYTQQTGAGIPAFPTGSLTWVYERGDGSYTVLQSFETGDIPNAILQVVTAGENPGIVYARIVMQAPITLTENDVGNYLVIDGSSFSAPELQGMQTIVRVDVIDNYVEVDVSGTQGYDFASNPSTTAPFVRVLREVRFPEQAAIPDYTFDDGDIVWIDDYSNGWAVLQWNGSTWTAIRNQPPYIDSTAISETTIYNNAVVLSNQQMLVGQPLINSLDVIDPMVGLLAGVCQREIDFQSEYDPAGYNQGAAISSADPWGSTQLGRVWWDLSAVRFLEPYTDTLGVTDARDLAELSNRLSAWAQIAPGTSVNVYEWTQSSVSPTTYSTSSSYPGTMYNASNPSWVEQTTVDAATGALSTVYYFWVTGLTTIPDVPFRNLAITDVAMGITNPSSLDLQWLAPIAADSLIVSGVSQFLNDASSVLRIELTLNDDAPTQHDQWILMRPGDETSLPPDQFWYQLRNSLAGFNADLQPLPLATLPPSRAVGIFPTQNMFVVNGSDGNRGGLMNARQAWVGSINNIFAQNPVAIQRQTYLSGLMRPASTTPPLGGYLIWTQIDVSYPYEPPPSNEWQIVVYSPDDRNHLVARSDFLAAVESNTSIRVLLSGEGNAVPYQCWSIWQFNPTVAQTIIADNPSLDPGVALLQNVSQVFSLATAYEWEVENEEGRIALVQPILTIAVGDRVLVDSDTNGFWAIWKYTPGQSNADVYGFSLWRVQPYRTSDFIEYVDWYAAGYSASAPPVVSYPTIAARNLAESANPTNTFVQVDDDGTGNWIWTAQVVPTDQPEVITPATNDTSLVWQTVANQNGTIALSSQFYNPLASVHGVTRLSVNDIANRDGSWELYILVHALNYSGMLIDSEINRNWFDMVNFCHVQQPDVDWAFMTSFMNIVGYNVPLEQTPYVVPDETDNLIDYVNTVKPYRVKIREFSTQYVTDIDIANGKTSTDFDKPVYFDPTINAYRTLNPATDTAILETAPWLYWYDNYQDELTPVRGLDITLAFDRYVGDEAINNWDIQPWDTTSWDDTEQVQTDVYVHTKVNQTLTTATTNIPVDDVRFLTGITSINLDGVNYPVSSFAIDNVNVSQTPHGFSGVIVINAAITASEGDVVEAVVPLPTAAERIITSYNPAVTMAPNDLDLLLNLDERGLSVVYQTTSAVSAGATVLPISSVDGLAVGQYVKGPGIIPGTTVTAVGDNSVTISAATVGPIDAGVLLNFNLPNWVDGYILNSLEPPVSEFDIVPFDTEDFDIITDIYLNTYDGSTLTTPDIDVSINPSPVVLTTTAAADSGAITLTVAWAATNLVGLPVLGTNVATGTVVSAVNGLVVSLSQPITGTINSGSAVTVLLGAFDFLAPYYAPNHPQERVPFLADDGLQLIVTTTADPGGPSQIIKLFNVSADTGSVTLFFDLIAQAAAGVMVFYDGVRQTLTSDYTVDQLSRTVTCTDVTGVSFVAIHAFGFGGLSVISERDYLSFEGNPLSLVEAASQPYVGVVVDGVLLASDEYTVSGIDVTLNSPPSDGTDVALVVYAGGIQTATTMTTQSLTYNVDQQWTLSPRDNQTVPEYGGTIVEVNGLRLTPPLAWYGQFTPTQEWMYLPYSNLSDTQVYVNGVLYTTSIPVCTTTSSTSTYPLNVHVPSPPPTDIVGQFVWLNSNVLIALDGVFAATVTVTFSSTDVTPDYTVETGLLTIDASLTSDDSITATTFSNANSMALQTVALPAEGNDEYIIPLPVSKNYILIAVNGYAMQPDSDYRLLDDDLGWDSTPFDSAPYDFSMSGVGIVQLLRPASGDFVATVTAGQAERETMQWRVYTDTPAFLRMSPAYTPQGERIYGMPTNGSNLVSKPKATYNISFDYLRQSVYMSGTLVDTLAPTDTQMVVSLFPKLLAPKLQEPNPLPQPTALRPGVVWVNNERIEYFGYSRSDDTVTLSGLRRQTAGTVVTEQREVASGVATGSSQTFVLDASDGTGEVQVTVAPDTSGDTPGQPTADFTTAIVDSNLEVTLTATAGSFVTVAMTVGYTYPVGTSVYNGWTTFTVPVPVGPLVGNRDAAPMTQMIAG